MIERSDYVIGVCDDRLSARGAAPRKDDHPEVKVTEVATRPSPTRSWPSG